jgi:hypothetical protein
VGAAGSATPAMVAAATNADRSPLVSSCTLVNAREGHAGAPELGVKEP